MAGFRGTWDALEEKARDGRRRLWSDHRAVTLIETGGYANDLWIADVKGGDTFTLINGREIQLYGIDAPESLQSYGLKARDALDSMA